MDVPRADADLGRQLESLVEAGRRAWPGVDVAPEVFVRALARSLGAEEEEDEEALQALSITDLYFATACLAHVPAAVSLLVARFFGAVRQALCRRTSRPAVVDDVLGNLSERLLFPRGDAPALLAQYAGRGSLEGWLLRAAWRDVLKALGREERSTSFENTGASFAPATSTSTLPEDPELDFFLRLYGPELRDAVADALVSLDPSDRQLLRQVVASHRSADIARSERVHRVTVSRWLATIRRRVLERVATNLAARLKLSVVDVQALMRHAGPDLELSVHRLLADKAPSTRARRKKKRARSVRPSKG